VGKHVVYVGTALCTIFALLPPAFVSAAAPASQPDYRLLKLEGSLVKWGDRRLGAGAVVSYAFATSPTRFESARNCGDLLPLDDLAARHGIPPETLQAEAAAAFRIWEAAANITFVALDDPAHANILIGAQGKPVGRAFADVMYQPGSEHDVKLIDKALVCLNPNQPWKVGFDGNISVYDIRYTLVHEIGHAIGLDHPGPTGQVMSFRYHEKFSDLQPGDFRGIQALYGTNLERFASDGLLPVLTK
jgi:hypothetical protein